MIPRSETDDDEEDDFTLIRSGPNDGRGARPGPDGRRRLSTRLVLHGDRDHGALQDARNPQADRREAPSAVAQGRSRTLDDYKDDYIIVEIDSSGAMKIDREPVAAEMNALVERLRTAREKTGRKAMLLSAEYATKHRNSVLAYDAANEIGLVPVIARPARPQGPGPNPFATPPAQRRPGAADPPASTPN